jgi:predicted CoA-binding protein
MRVIVVGASSDRAKYGNKAVRAYLRRGHEVFPVNPSETMVEGLPVYAGVSEVPGPIDRATFYIPPRYARGVLEALAARGDVAEVYFNPGSETPELLAYARSLGLKTTYGCSIIDIGERPD